MSEGVVAGNSIVAIIALYNGAKYIERSLGSVLAQTLQPDEIIVVDDGSTDGGLGAALVEGFRKENPRIRLLRKANGGQSSTRNFGVKNSSGKLVALLDQDDAWYPNHLERLLFHFRRYKGGLPLGWVYSNVDEIDESGTLVHRGLLNVFPSPHPKASLWDCMSHDMFILPSASLISRTAFEAVGGFDERLMGYEDDDFFLRLFAAGYANVYINESLSQWRIHTASTSFTDRMAKSRMIYAFKLIEMFPDNRKLHRFWARDVIVPRFVRSLEGQIVRGVLDNNRKLRDAAIKDFWLLARHLRIFSRIKHTAIFPLMRYGTVAKGALALRNCRQSRR
jgi:glycosyltransferase involved in cell wall biosynthesis